MQISVRGEKSVRVAPERAEVHATVTFEGVDRARVVADTAAAANRLASDLEGLKASGAVERFSVQPLRSHAWRPERGAERVSASVEVAALFADFEALGRLTSDLGAREGVQLGWVSWQLTDATADRLRDECIQGAVDRARHRAEAMARAAGAKELEIVEIADPGLLGSGEVRMEYAAPAMAMGRQSKGGAADAVQAVPEEIEVGAQLQLRFATV